jgi:hypothetical protein
MAEGLNPIESGKKLHEHGKKSDEPIDETKANDGDGSRHSHTVQICEAALLALVTLAAAWSGYAAAKWNTESRVEIARASALRDLATRNTLTALNLRNFDGSSFNAWFIAFTLNDKEKQRVAERRFRPVFRRAFEAWLATKPFENPNAPPGPTYMPQYKLSAQIKANEFDKQATEKLNSGSHAGEIGDNYVRITVFLAAVLFLVGIGSSFKLLGVRYALIALGSVLLVVSIVLITQQPGLPD